MKKENTAMDKEEILWRVNYKVLNCYLEFFREEGFWITTNQSWNLARWNIYGNVLISEHAVKKFLCHKELEKNSKAIEWGGRKGSRCFVAEHVVPFSIVKDLYLEKFKNNNPTYDQYRDFFLHFNRVCYVWHREDECLKDIGYNHNVPEIENIENQVFGRYLEANIKHIQTKYKTGNELFKALKNYRNENLRADKVINLIQ